MHRELDPSLFKSPEDQKTSENNIQGQKTSSPMSHQWSENSMGFQQLEINELKQQLKLSQKRQDALDEKISKLSSQSFEAIKTNFHKLERLSKEFARIDEFQKKLYEEFHKNFASMNSKINEKRMNDSKVEELLDRQNMVIRNFENRLASLQRILSEKEGQLMNYANLLRDAQREMDRLKGN